MTLDLVPITLADAKRFVALHHRHNLPPCSWKFGVGVEEAGALVGVALVGRPVARKLDRRVDAGGRLVEILRTCTTGARNANSALYGASCRAAKALGYWKAITYTLEDEPGSSLLAAGFEIEEIVDPPPGGWKTRRAPQLFEDPRRYPDGRKIRWRRVLDPRGVAIVSPETEP